jgi:PQQ-like domain
MDRTRVTPRRCAARDGRVPLRVVLLTRPLHLAAAAAAVALAGWLALSLVSTGPRGAPAPDRRPGWLATFDVADQLGAMAAGHGDLWMDDRAAGRLLRVDGRNGRVVSAVPVRGRLAVGAGPTGVWALEAGGDYGIGLRGPLLRVDAATGQVQARVPLGGVLGFGLLVRGGDVWVWGPRDVLRIDARTNRVARRIRVGGAHGELRGVALRRGRLFVAAADGRLTRFDARTGARLGAVSLPLVAPMIRAVAGRRLVLSSRGSVAAVDPATGRVAWQRKLGFRVGAVVPARGRLWVHSAARDDPGDRLTELDPATGEVRGSALLPAFGTTGVALDRGRLWLATAGGRALAVTLAAGG